MAKKTYRTKEEAYEVASRGDGNLIYKVKNGWRIRKRSKSKKRVSVKAYSRKKARKNSGQFPRSEKEDEIFSAKVVQARNLIDDYLRLKELMDSVRNKISDLLK